MRGKAPAGFADFRQGGITPACAGKSAVAAENRLLIPGSPPRVRGKVFKLPKAVKRAGITPACAGKRPGVRRRCTSCRDHPRVCGEKFRLTSVTTPQRGSPPRMRGKELSVSAHCHICGITPAYAGKSEAVNGPGIAGKDHPRVCGEKRYSWEKSTCKIGSPPRMRGKGYPCRYLQRDVGITPAYAGKRSGGCFPANRGRDHPRVCGEKQTRGWTRSQSLGSPPRMRGKGLCLLFLFFQLGITPAYAGKRYPLTGNALMLRDHPRVCGEKEKSSRLPGDCMGSPPRMRGKD